MTRIQQTWQKDKQSCKNKQVNKHGATYINKQVKTRQQINHAYP